MGMGASVSDKSYCIHCKKLWYFNLSVVITIKYIGHFNHLVVIAVGILQPTV